MQRSLRPLPMLGIALAGAAVVVALAQTPGNPPPQGGERPPFGGPPTGEEPPDFGGPPTSGPGGRRPGGFGPGPFGGVQEETKLVKRFDTDGDKRLDAAERKAARESLAKERAAGGGRRGPGFRGPGAGFGGPGPGFGGSAEPPTPGPALKPEEVRSFPDAPVYDLQTLRTFFLEFEAADWEKELEDFYNTDVEVPATLTVDGRAYPDVGVHFRGATSFFTVGTGRKRPLNLALDFVHDGQQLGGYRTFNLLNSHMDPTFLRTVLYYQIAREFIPAPKANYVRVVINGECWGVYISAQQFNKDFTRDWFDSTQGARWKVPGSPGGRGGLTYLGEDAREYKRIYDLKTKDDPAAWAALIRLCKALNETPPDQLEAALAPQLDIEGTLKFLALENVLINSDGYWIRSSDYNLYLDEKGRFHLVPHDVNETFRAADGPGGPGGRGGPGGGSRGVQLDPLASAGDANRPLLSKLLAVPALRARYLGYVRQIAEEWLDWNKLGPLAAQHQALIAEAVKADTRNLHPYEAFQRGVTAEATDPGGFRGPRGGLSLKSFADQRRAYLLGLPAVRDAERPALSSSGL